jgi:hypothetical protein
VGCAVRYPPICGKWSAASNSRPSSVRTRSTTTPRLSPAPGIGARDDHDAAPPPDHDPHGVPPITSALTRARRILVDLLGGRVPDAAKVAEALAAGTFGTDDPGFGEVTSRWQRWWAQRLAEHGPDCFDPHRFEHAAEVSVAGAVLRAPEYLGDGLDWSSVDVATDPDLQPAPAGVRHVFTDEGLPSTVRYGGLPADRFWEMEDARVDLGATEVSALDTGRLLLISFATVFGNDWYLCPSKCRSGRSPFWTSCSCVTCSVATTSSGARASTTRPGRCSRSAAPSPITRRRPGCWSCPPNPARSVSRWSGSCWPATSWRTSRGPCSTPTPTSGVAGMT